jgi:hypothetical protein
MKHRSTAIRAKEIQEIVAMHYRPGEHSRSRSAVYRNFVQEQKGISRATFCRYIHADLSEMARQEDPRQLKIPFD